MRIITISRQFGSGGRELGRKIAELSGWDYYDKNIIQKICEKDNLDEEFVRRSFHDDSWSAAQPMYNTFSQLDINSTMHLSLLESQTKVIKDIAKLGRDCIIVGRDADVLLKEYHPFRLYACADFDFRLDRCLKREEKNEGYKLTEKQIIKNIHRIDKRRKRERIIMTGRASDDTSVFDLIVTTSSWKSIDELAKSVYDFALSWFE